MGEAGMAWLMRWDTTIKYNILQIIHSSARACEGAIRGRALPSGAVPTSCNQHSHGKIIPSLQLPFWLLWIFLPPTQCRKSEEVLQPWLIRRQVPRPCSAIRHYPGYSYTLLLRSVATLSHTFKQPPLQLWCSSYLWQRGTDYRRNQAGTISLTRSSPTSPGPPLQSLISNKFESKPIKQWSF